MKKYKLLFIAFLFYLIGHVLWSLAIIFDDPILISYLVEEWLINIPFFREIYLFHKKKINKVNNNILIYQIIRDSIDLMVKDLIKNTIHNLKINKVSNIKKMYNSVYPIVCFSNKFINIEKEIRFFLRQKMYNNKNVLIKNSSGKKIVKNLYSLISKNPYKFLSWSQLNNNKTRAIADFITGMTDRYAVNLYNSKK